MPRKPIALVVVLVAAGVAAWLLLRGGRHLRVPDIVLVILDTTRADALSCYGNPRMTSPNIDALAERSTVFLRATSASPWTGPAVASIFTGQYPSEHGLHLEHLRLKKHRSTIAEVLKASGYQTAAFSNNPFISSQFGLDQGFETFVDVWRQVTPEQLKSTDPGGRLTNRLVGEWLDEERDPARPLFLVVHYMEPHLPYNPAPPFDRMFLDDGVDEDMVRGVTEWKVLSELGYILRQFTFSEEQLSVFRALYHSDIAYADRLVADLMATLQSRSLFEDSLFILTADHGENLGEHHMLDHKFCVYEPLLKVPLIVRYPGVLPAGARIAEPVQTTDIFATVVEAAGGLTSSRLRRTPPLRGPRSMDRPVHAQHYRPRLFMRTLRGAYPKADVTHLDRRLSSVEVGGMKYIWASDGHHELYDLAADPGELSNLVEERPEVVNELEKLRIELK